MFIHYLFSACFLLSHNAQWLPFRKAIDIQECYTLEKNLLYKKIFPLTIVIFHTKKVVHSQIYKQQQQQGHIILKR